MVSCGSGEQNNASGVGVALGAQVGHVVTYLDSPEGSLIYTALTKKRQKRSKKGGTILVDFGPIFVVFDRFWPIWNLLDPFGPILTDFRSFLTIFVPFWTNFDHFGILTILGRFWTTFDHFGPFWDDFALFWTILTDFGRFRLYFWTILTGLVPFRTILGEF